MNDANVIPDMIADPSAFEDDARFRLRAAQAAIRRECGWHVMPNTALSGVINTRGGTVIRLPARHVTSIESLTDRDGNKLAYAYDPETGLVEALSGGCAAKRAGMSPIGLVTSQSANGSSASYDAVSLMQAEKDKLKPYKLGGLP